MSEYQTELSRLRDEIVGEPFGTQRTVWKHHCHLSCFIWPFYKTRMQFESETPFQVI